jgi:hypothetical protein
MSKCAASLAGCVLSSRLLANAVSSARETAPPATFVDRSDKREERQHQQWISATLHAFDAMALPGGYPNLLARGDADRVTSYGRNADRLVKAKRHYDPDHVFSSAIPLPASRPRLRRFQFALRALVQSLRAQ